MLRHLKRWWLLYLLLLFILYLVIGAAAPFARYRKLSEETIRNADKLAADIPADSTVLPVLGTLSVTALEG